MRKIVVFLAAVMMGVALDFAYAHSGGTDRAFVSTVIDLDGKLIVLGQIR